MSFTVYKDLLHAKSSTVEIGRLRLVAQDGFVFDVDGSLFDESSVLNNMLSGLTNDPSPSCDSSIDMEAIHLPFDGYELQQALRFLSFLAGGGDKKNFPSLAVDDILKTWKIGDYFGLERLKQEATSMIAATINVPSITTVRRRLNVRCDFSDKEQKQMQCEALDEVYPAELKTPK